MTELVPVDKFSRLPERYQRRAREIDARVGSINAELRHCSTDEIGETLKRMRRHFRPQPDTEPREMAEGFKDACRDLPAWAISAAANAFLAGRVGNHSGQFMPTCAEFAKRAREEISPLLSEHLSLRIEASKLIERAEDDHRRHLIEMEKQDPAVKARVSQLTVAAFSGLPTKQVTKHRGLSDETRAGLDALRKPRSFTSKIDHTKIARQSGE